MFNREADVLLVNHGDGVVNVEVADSNAAPRSSAKDHMFSDGLSDTDVLSQVILRCRSLSKLVAIRPESLMW
jgi:hypothetical protein